MTANDPLPTLIRRGVVTVDPAKSETCCGLERDADGFCINKPRHPVFVRVPNAEEIARRFHAEYEHLAPAYGYETRPESAVPWEDVPEQNRKLMTHVVSNLLAEGVISASTVPDRLPDNDESRGHGSVR